MPMIDLEKENNPLVIADDLTRVIAKGLRDGSIALYSAFLLNHDVLRLRRRGYHQPAWQSGFSVSGVLALYMQCLFARAIGEQSIAQSLASWIERDGPLIIESRKHYILEILKQGSIAEPTDAQLTALSRIRSSYATLSDDDGPFHTEVFPYTYFSPEDALLDGNASCVEKGTIEPQVQDLMLQISEWE